MEDGSQQNGFSWINKFTDLEEKQKILRERILTLGDSFIKNRDEIFKEILDIKSEIKSLKVEIEKIRGVVEHLLEESGDFARKEEMSSLQRIVKIFDPLKILKEEDVRRIVKEEMGRK